MYYTMPTERYGVQLTVEYTAEHPNGRTYDYEVTAERVWHKGDDILELLSPSELCLLETDARDHYAQQHHPAVLRRQRLTDRADDAWHDGAFPNALQLMQEGLLE